MPNFKLADGTTLGELMHDGRGILLDFTGNNSLQAWASGFSDQVKYVAGPAKDQLGLRAALVRPDGIIAWATDHAATGRELQAAAARWFGELARSAR